MQVKGEAQSSRVETLNISRDDEGSCVVEIMSYGKGRVLKSYDFTGRISW